MIFALDLAAMVSAFIAAWLWWKASCTLQRRVAKSEELDYHDINRIITSFNRTQMLNSRAAVATAMSALCVALRFAAALV